MVTAVERDGDRDGDRGRGRMRSDDDYCASVKKTILYRTILCKDRLPTQYTCEQKTKVQALYASSYEAETSGA